MSCLRRTGHVISKIAVAEGLNLPVPLVNIVRGIKPRWLPKSKSKIFYVRTPTPIDPEENEETRTAYFHYRTQIRAVRKFLLDQHLAKVNVMLEKSAAEDRDHAAELQLMEELNNQWNSRVAPLREAAWLEEKEKQDGQTRRWMERDQRRKAKRLEKAEEKLERDLKETDTFITLDNLDTEIEKLLNLRQDYNFAIDKQGNRISETDDDSPSVNSLPEQAAKL
ncbi:small ribosomal subunit protein mS26-like [Babylonia areolata]|uniref:small ribosomal subunit protein mS26-like n=1 Tax=Babylonia areolata TaxID=304850 RepID=UPI003FD2F2B1